MKRFISLLIVTILCFSLAACGAAKGSDQQSSEKPGNESGSESIAPSGTDDKKPDPVVYGNEYCGYVTIEDGILRGVGNTDDMVDMNIWDGQSMARITIEKLSFSKEDPDFDYAAKYLHSSYFNAYNGPDKIYSNEMEYEATLDGSPAVKITAERPDSKGLFDKIYCIGYVTTSADGGYVQISISSPNSDSVDIETSLPSVEKLADLVERTYRKVVE